MSKGNEWRKSWEWTMCSRCGFNWLQLVTLGREPQKQCKLCDPPWWQKRKKK